MKPVFQTQFAGTQDAPSDEVGNCYQAAIASLLELELEDVPHFVAMGDKWWEGTIKWMNERGKGVAWIPVGDGLEANLKPSGYHLMSGGSPRGDFLHEVVALDGAVAHDPHPSGDGLTFISGWTIIYDMKETKSV